MEALNRKHFDEDLRFGEAGQKWLLWLADEAMVEVKAERDKWHKTGNLYFEYECRGQPSGFAATRSHYWAHILHLNGTNHGVMVFHTKRLKENLRLLIKEKNPAVQLVKGGDDRATKGVLVHLSCLKELVS